ncbi:MAG: LysR family transcriptional regulator [SAR324 cluster bacterium]|nr:LysR family transcriptional regulator [SAR324 cluster bacterium]
MTLDQIKIFVTVAKLGSLAAAAKYLNKTQPTLSVGLKNLEDNLGTQLFSREQYRMTISPAGEKLLQKAQFLLNQADEFENLGQYFGSGAEPELKIVIDPMIPLQIILKVLRNFEKKHQQTQITLISKYLSGGIEMLMAGEVDLAFVVWPKIGQEVTFFPLLDLSMKLVISPKSPLFGQQTITEPDLLNQPQVIIRDSAEKPTKDQFGVLEGGRHWDVTDAQTKKEIILAGMGWGTLPLHMVEKELAKGDLCPMEYKEMPQDHLVSAFLAKGKRVKLGPVAQELWEEFQNLAPLV